MSVSGSRYAGGRWNTHADIKCSRTMAGQTKRCKRWSGAGVRKGVFQPGGGKGGTHCSGVQEWGSKQKEEEENSRPPLLQTFRRATNRIPHPMTCFSSSSPLPPAASLLPHILSPRSTLHVLPPNTSLEARCTTVYHACIHPPTLFCPYFPSPSLLPLCGLRGPAAIAPAFATFPDHCRRSTKNLNLIGGRAAKYERPTSASTFLLDIVPLCPQQKLALMTAVKLYATGYQ